MSEPRCPVVSPMVSRALPAIFFFSGCAALIFENLWFYQAGITFGNSVWASSLVLAGFMGGLALGNALAARLRSGRFRAVRLYGLLELAIGIVGFGLVVALPSLTALLADVLRPLLGATWALNSLRLAFAFGLLLIPSTAMGATLPVMVSALYRQDPRFGSVLGRLYGWNTLGAVVGALAGDFFLVEALGIRGTGIVAAGICVTIATLAFALSKRMDEKPAEPEEQAPRPRLTANARWLLVAAGLSGFALLGLEVVWFRFLLHFMFGSSETFAILLATVLAGIGAGGLAGGYVTSRSDDAVRFLPAIAALTGFVCIALYMLYPAGPMVDTWGKTTARAVTLMFPVSFLSGVLFTGIGQALQARVGDETRSAGLLTLANTTGAMLGPLTIGFLLLPAVGVDRCFQALSALYLGVAAATWVAGARPTARQGAIGTAVAALALVAAVAAFPAGSTLERHLEPVVEPYLVGPDAEPVAMREGLTETIIYLEERAFGEPVAYRMLTNGYSMSGTSTGGQRYMKLFVYLPTALNPGMKSALLISYGVGMTAKALTNTPSLESIDVVDISRDVIEMNDIVYPEKSEHPLHDPRVRTHIEDGRYFLQTTEKSFDLITGEPPPPKMAGIVSLYTREYFALVEARLSEGGIASYWLPAHVLSPDDSKSIIRAFCDAFADCTLWGGAGMDWILIGTRNAEGPGSALDFAKQWANPTSGAELEALGVERPEQMGALFMAGQEDLVNWASNVEPLTDDRPKRLSGERFDLVAGIRAYLPWIDPRSARSRFEQSPWIAEVWPPGLRSATLPYFSAQADINRALIESSRRDLSETLPKVHELLTSTRLSTLPLWLLGSDEPRQVAARKAQAGGEATATTYAELALGALSQRDFGSAYTLLMKASDVGKFGPDLTTLALYAILMRNEPSARPTILAKLSASGQTESLEPWVMPFMQSIL